MNCILKAWQQHEASLPVSCTIAPANQDEADDLLQEVFLRAVGQSETFPTLRNRRAWLFHVARCLLVYHLRLTKNPVPLPDG